MECLGPQCASMLLEWLRAQKLGETTATAATAKPAGESAPGRTQAQATTRQGVLWTSVAYQEDAPAIRDAAELAGALEHLEYAIFRRYENQLTRAERARLDNTIQNTLFKLERYARRLGGADGDRVEAEYQALRTRVVEARERSERLRSQARRAELKLSQLATLTPEGFEEFVAELFEALGYEVERVGGSGDEGADLLVRKAGLLGVVQCKYHKRGVVGSPDLQKFLGTVHHTRSHKGFFVTTSTFSLAGERFVAEHPIELVDGPRLVELVHEALGPGARREPEPVWF